MLTHKRKLSHYQLKGFKFRMRIYLNSDLQIHIAQIVKRPTKLRPQTMKSQIRNKRRKSVTAHRVQEISTNVWTAELALNAVRSYCKIKQNFPEILILNSRTLRQTQNNELQNLHLHLHYTTYYITLHRCKISQMTVGCETCHILVNTKNN
jgi:hypothetical protein